VIGVELRAPSPNLTTITIVEAMRSVGAAGSMSPWRVRGAPLSEADYVELIRNVGRYCRRFVILDLVRHRLP